MIVQTLLFLIFHSHTPLHHQLFNLLNPWISSILPIFGRMSCKVSPMNTRMWPDWLRSHISAPPCPNLCFVGLIKKVYEWGNNFEESEQHRSQCYVLLVDHFMWFVCCKDQTEMYELDVCWFSTYGVWITSLWIIIEFVFLLWSCTTYGVWIMHYAVQEKRIYEGGYIICVHGTEKTWLCQQQILIFSSPSSPCNNSLVTSVQHMTFELTK